MFARTSIDEAPWYIVEGNDKRRARLNCIAHVLSLFPYEPVPHAEITLPDRVFNPDYKRAALPPELYVPQKFQSKRMRDRNSSHPRLLCPGADFFKEIETEFSKIPALGMRRDSVKCQPASGSPGSLDRPAHAL